MIMGEGQYMFSPPSWTGKGCVGMVFQAFCYYQGFSGLAIGMFQSLQNTFISCGCLKKVRYKISTVGLIITCLVRVKLSCLFLVLTIGVCGWGKGFANTLNFMIDLGENSVVYDFMSFMHKIDAFLHSDLIRYSI